MGTRMTTTHPPRADRPVDTDEYDRMYLDAALEAACAPPAVCAFARVLLFFYDLEFALGWLEKALDIPDAPAAEARFGEKAGKVAGRLRREGVGHG